MKTKLPFNKFTAQDFKNSKSNQLITKIPEQKPKQSYLPSSNQSELIKNICEVLNIEFKGEYGNEAKNFILNNLDDYAISLEIYFEKEHIDLIELILTR